MSSTFPKKSAFERMKSLYGENQEILDSFDSECSISCFNGTFVGKIKNNVLSFKGIPFAKPPVGDLRWKAPISVEKSNKVFQAYYFGKSPLQAPWFSELASCYPNSEDCLYLNIWCDPKTISKKKAVMVFIHGGAYGYGGTSDPIYDGQNFLEAHKDVILVTIGYRVGMMGFIDFSEVSGSEGYDDAPNLGLLDQIEALKWIQQNIEFFGGDKENVTVFGESAGGGSVSLLPIMPLAKGLFKRVIGESGSVALTYSKQECLSFTRKLLKLSRAKCMDDLLKLSEEELLKINLSIAVDNNFPQRDGRIIPLDPYKEYENGVTKDIDMLMGTNKDECRYWINEIGGLAAYAIGAPLIFDNQIMRLSPEDRKKVREFYSKNDSKNVTWKLTSFENDLVFRVPTQYQLQKHSENGGNAYHYHWTWPCSNRKIGACHAVELAFVFNNLQETIYTGGHVKKSLADVVQQMWVNFAKTGNPSTENQTWPKYVPETKQTMVLGEDIFIKNNLFSRRTKLIQKLLKYYINGSYAELNFKTPYVGFVVAGLILFISLIIGVIVLLVNVL